MYRDSNKTFYMSSHSPLLFYSSESLGEYCSRLRGENIFPEAALMVSGCDIMS